MSVHKVISACSLRGSAWLVDSLRAESNCERNSTARLLYGAARFAVPEVSSALACEYFSWATNAPAFLKLDVAASQFVSAREDSGPVCAANTGVVSVSAASQTAPMLAFAGQECA